MQVGYVYQMANIQEAVNTVRELDSEPKDLLKALGLVQLVRDHKKIDRRSLVAVNTTFSRCNNTPRVGRVGRARYAVEHPAATRLCCSTRKRCGIERRPSNTYRSFEWTDGSLAGVPLMRRGAS